MANSGKTRKQHEQFSVVAMCHSDIIAEHNCSGELIELADSSRRVQHVMCSYCGTEFIFVPDSTWIMMVTPGMRCVIGSETTRKRE